MNDEILALNKNKTWVLVNAPPKAKILSNRWVYKIKTSPNGNKKFRARLVIKGYLQKKDIDYKEIFSPVVRYNSIRVFLAITASQKMYCMQFDVRSAFLNGDLQKTVYMKQLEGFEDESNRVF